MPRDKLVGLAVPSGLAAAILAGLGALILTFAAAFSWLCMPWACFSSCAKFDCTLTCIVSLIAITSPVKHFTKIWYS
jgi:hypothetical protein